MSLAMVMGSDASCSFLDFISWSITVTLLALATISMAGCAPTTLYLPCKPTNRPILNLSAGEKEKNTRVDTG